MATFRAGTISIDADSIPILNTLVLDPSGQGYTLWDATEAKHANFPEIAEGLKLASCLYDPLAVEYVNNGHDKYTGEIYLLPVDKRRFPHHISLGELLELVKVFILTKSNTSDVITGLWSGRKFEFIYPRYGMPLALIQSILAKTFQGQGTMFEVIAPILFDEIPVNGNDHDTVESVDSVLLGSAMATYKIPWDKPGAPFDIYNFGRRLDWNKTVQDNGITRFDVIYCQLYKPGNKLTAYGGAGKNNWSYSGLDAALDIVLGYVGGKL